MKPQEGALLRIGHKDKACKSAGIIFNVRCEAESRGSESSDEENPFNLYDVEPQ